jgi:hypothetical protein
MMGVGVWCQTINHLSKDPKRLFSLNSADQRACLDRSTPKEP